MRCLGKVALLVLYDWGLQGSSAEGRRDLLEIVEARYGRKSILIASQIPVEHLPGTIGEPAIADAVLDRVIHNGYHIELRGESQRKRNRPPLGGSKKRSRPDDRVWTPVAPGTGITVRKTRRLCQMERPAAATTGVLKQKAGLRTLAVGWPVASFGPTQEGRNPAPVSGEKGHTRQGGFDRQVFPDSPSSASDLAPGLLNTRSGQYWMPIWGSKFNAG